MVEILFFKPGFIRKLWDIHFSISFENCLKRFEKSLSFNTISDDWVFKKDSFYGEMLCVVKIYGINTLESSRARRPWLITGTLSSHIRVRVPSSVLPAVLVLPPVFRRILTTDLNLRIKKTPIFTGVMSFEEVCTYLSSSESIFMNYLPIDTKH